MDMVNFELLAYISVMTTLTTECIKKLLNKADMNYISNIIAAVSSLVISGVICVIYPVVMLNASISPQLIFKWLVMAFFAVLAAMLGFDKIVQTIAKLKE